MSGRKLTYTFGETGGHTSLSVEPIERDFVERRMTYRWVIDFGDSETYKGDDLRSGSGEPVNLPRMLGSLLSFLGAFAEARRYGSPSSDNWTLFPDGLAEWAMAMSDELEMVREKIEFPTSTH